MGIRNPLLECLGRYSESNLALMIFDNQYDLAESVWRLADRHIHRTMIADNDTYLDFIGLVEGSFYNGVLLRRVENLSARNQLYLMDRFIKMTKEQKGKIIFTTDDFNRVEAGLLMQVCKIKFRIESPAANCEVEQPFIDVEAVQKEVGRFF